MITKIKNVVGLTGKDMELIMKKNTFAITATLITLSLALTGCSKPANIAGGDNSDTYNLLNSTVTSSATASETTSGAFNPLTGLYD